MIVRWEVRCCVTLKIPWRSGEGNSNPLQYSCLGNPMDRGAWQAYKSMGSQRVGLDLGIKQQKEREDCGKAGPPGSFLFLLLTCMGFILFCVVITKMYFGFCTFLFYFTIINVLNT